MLIANTMLSIKAVRDGFVGRKVCGKTVSYAIGVGAPDGKQLVALVAHADYLSDPSDPKWDVVGIIDRETGENIAEDRCRPAYTLEDAGDVALEMYLER